MKFSTALEDYLLVREAWRHHCLSDSSEAMAARSRKAMDEAAATLDEILAKASRGTLTRTKT